jgi:hypothetical protein
MCLHQLLAFSLDSNEPKDLRRTLAHDDLLVSTFTSVEDGTALVGTSELLRMVEHLLPFAYRAFLLNDYFSVQFLCAQGLNRGMLCAEHGGKRARL